VIIYIIFAIIDVISDSTAEVKPWPLQKSFATFSIHDRGLPVSEPTFRRLLYIASDDPSKKKKKGKAIPITGS
jgi:hypothetical protein